MEDHGNLDGSGGYIFESVCSHVGGNVIKGAIVGGFFGAAKFRLDNPRNALPQNSPGEMLPEGGSGGLNDLAPNQGYSSFNSLKKT